MMNRGIQWIGGIAIGLAAGLIVTSAFGQHDAPSQDSKPLTVRDFPDLGAGLMATPGCLGVKAFSTEQGKQFVIMAWFENKKAVKTWYYSKMHMDAMAKFFPGISPKPPLENFKDEKSPIMLIASVTPSDKPKEGQQLAVSQIAIEAYTPVPGGIALGGTFAPASLHVKGLSRVGK